MTAKEEYKQIRGVIYDLDSTIIDTVGLHVKGMEAVGKKFGITIDLNLYEKYYGRKLRDFIAVLYNDRSEFERNIEDILRFKRQHFLRHIEEVKIFPGFEETIKKLKQEKKELWICTSAPGIYLEELAKTKPTLAYFKNRTTFQEMFSQGKPHPESLLLTMRLMGGLSPDECLYVGDAESDYMAAENAGIKFMLFSPGTDKRVIDIPADIPRLQNHEDILEYLI